MVAAETSGPRLSLLRKLISLDFKELDERSEQKISSGGHNQLCPIYDVNNAGMREKFVYTIIFANQGNKDFAHCVNTPIFKQWQQQVDFQFGFVPLGGQLMLENLTLCNSQVYSPIEMHTIVKTTGTFICGKTF